MIRYRWSICAVFLAAHAANTRSEDLPLYRITVIPNVVDDVERPKAIAINDAGVVAGEVQLRVPGRPAPRKQVFRWTAAEGSALMPTGRDGAYPASVGGVDSFGRVFGTVFKPGQLPRAVLWKQADHFRALTRGEYSVDTRVSGVNAFGDAVGSRANPKRPGKTQAMFWAHSGDPVVIFSPSAYPPVARSVNNAGQVTGSDYYSLIQTQVFLWSAADGFRVIGRLPGSDMTGYADGKAINDHGAIAGIGSVDLDSRQRPFQWTAANGFRVIELPDACVADGSMGLNNSGWMVGNCYYAGLGPYLWTLEHGVRFIDELIDPADPLRASVSLYEVSAINSGGAIVGTGVLGGFSVPVVLTPLP